MTPGVVGGFVALGVLLRWWILTGPAGTVNSDEAITGLMGRRLLTEGEWPAFFWGQPYGGTLEPALGGVAQWLFGTGPVVLRLVPMACRAVAAVLVWRIGRRLASEQVGRIAGVLAWVAPAAAVWGSTKANGFYGLTLVGGCAVVLLVLRIADRPTMTDWGALGLAVGLGWWTSPQTLYVTLPALVWLLTRGPRAVGLSPGWMVAAPAAVLGMLPALVWNLRDGRAGIEQLPAPENSGSYGDHLRAFWRVGLTTVSGVRTPALSGAWLFGPGLGIALTVVVVAAVVAGVWWGGRRVLVVTAIVAAYPFLLAVPTYSYYLVDGRYLTTLFPMVALLAAVAVDRLGIAVPAVLAAAGLCAVGLVTLDRGPVAPEVRAPAHLDELEAVLRDHDVVAAQADYWIAYRLTWETDEQIIVVPERRDRFPIYTQFVDEHLDGAAVITFTDSTRDHELAFQMSENPELYETAVVGAFTVYFVDLPSPT